MRRLGAWAGGVCFALHPAQVESVVWISERKNVLVAAGMLTSVWCYLRAASSPTGSRQSHHLRGRPEVGQQRRSLLTACFAGRAQVVGWRWGRLLAGVGALLCKATAVVTPLLCLVTDRRVHGRSWRDGWRRTWPLWAAALIVGVMHLSTQRGMLGLSGWRAGSPDGALGVLVRAWARYLQMLVQPDLLGLYHPIDASVPSGGWRDPLVWHGAMWLAGIALVVGWLRRRLRIDLWCWWFVITLAPLASILFIGVQDRHLYLPMVGVAGIAGACVDALAHWAAGRRGRSMLLIAAAAVLISTCWMATWQRVALWGDETALYVEAARHAPDEEVPRVILADALVQSGQTAQAAQVLRHLADSAPAHWEGWLIRAWACTRLGDAACAQAHLQRAIALQPAHPLARQMEAEMAVARQDWPAAVAAYQQMTVGGVHASIARRIAALAERLHQPAAAVPWYRRVVAEEPWQGDAQRGLARCLRLAGGAAPGEIARAEALAAYWDGVRRELADQLQRVSDAYRRRGRADLAARAARVRAMLLPAADPMGTPSQVWSDGRHF